MGEYGDLLWVILVSEHLDDHGIAGKCDINFGQGEFFHAILVA